MKFFELQPTDENVLNAFENNSIDRNVDVVRFVELLNIMEYSASIALDARWGAGKTFFVKQSKMILDAFNEHVVSPNDINRGRIKSAWNRIQKNNKPDLQPQISVYYDAWLNDNDEDPVLSLVYTILQSVSTDYEFKRGPECIKIASIIAQKFTGYNLTGILDALKSEDPLANLRQNKNIHMQVEEFLESLLAEQGNRLVIFVDELDRCKPTFAVKLLERIKHYFANDRITFVFSVNISELQHTIKQYYGASFDACKYLDRFFDLRVDLPPADMDSFYRKIGLQDTRWTFENVCRAVIDAHNFSLREVAKFYRLARTAAFKPMHDNVHSYGSPHELAVQFCLMCVVPIMMGLKISNQSRLDAFIHGRDSSPLHDILDDNTVACALCKDMLMTNETYEISQVTTQIRLVTLADKLDQVYNALFVFQYASGIYEKRVGKMAFSAETKKELMQAVSLLSDYADYKI